MLKWLIIFFIIFNLMTGCDRSSGMSGRDKEGYPESDAAKARDLKIISWLINVSLEASLRAARRQPDEKNFQQVIKYLSDLSPKIRGQAAQNLIDFGDERSIDPLIEAYKKERVKSVKYEILETLGHIGSREDVIEFLINEKSISALGKAINRRDNTIRFLAIDALIKFLKEDKDEKIRRNAVSCLSLLTTAADDIVLGNDEIQYPRLPKSKEEEIIEEIKKVLEKDKFASVRLACVRTLYELAKRRAIPVLEKCLLDTDSGVAAQAACKLTYLGSRAGFDIAMKFLQDETTDRDTLQNSVMTLKKIGDKRALPVLRKALKNPKKRAARNEIWSAVHDRSLNWR